MRRRHVEILQVLQDRVTKVWRNNESHPDAHIEHAIHFAIGDLTHLLKKAKQLRSFPAVLPNHGVDAALKNTRKIPNQPSTRDVRYGVHDPLAAITGKQPLQWLNVNPSRLEE